MVQMDTLLVYQVSHVLPVSMDDSDTVRGLSGRSSSKKKIKVDKDDMRSVEILEELSPVKSRGLSIDQRMDIIELA